MRRLESHGRDPGRVRDPERWGVHLMTHNVRSGGPGGPFGQQMKHLMRHDERIWVKPPDPGLRLRHQTHPHSLVSSRMHVVCIRCASG